MKKIKKTEKVGISDRAGVVIMDKNKKVIKEITSEKKDDKPNR